ncbi:MAG: adenylyltransferase/cytidyltransferase family protein [bacterium]
MFYTISSIGPVCRKLHAAGCKLVLATGFFDLLHAEHIKFLAKAKAAGDILIVAVESDERARVLKGEGRPIEPQPVRCQHLLDLRSPGSDLLRRRPMGVFSRARSAGETRSDPQSTLVDYVISLPPDFNNFASYDSLMSAVRPQVYAVSAHTSHQKSKDFLVEKYGGKLLVVHDFNPAISTTQIIQNTRI